MGWRKMKRHKWVKRWETKNKERKVREEIGKGKRKSKVCKKMREQKGSTKLPKKWEHCTEKCLKYYTLYSKVCTVRYTLLYSTEHCTVKGVYSAVDCTVMFVQYCTLYCTVRCVQYCTLYSVCTVYLRHVFFALMS